MVVSFVSSTVLDSFALGSLEKVLPLRKSSKRERRRSTVAVLMEYWFSARMILSTSMLMLSTSSSDCLSISLTWMPPISTMPRSVVLRMELRLPVAFSCAVAIPSTSLMLNEWVRYASTFCRLNCCKAMSSAKSEVSML